MTDRTRFEYFAAKAAEEHRMSRAATDPRARAAHAEMAMHYIDLATEFLPDESANPNPSASAAHPPGAAPSAR